ncbi:MAG: substrate-binding domain-containing protein [Acidimicrobiia bacterium]|nr:substrate-binding domain-containing protein [Acidimicrobiia bacterium]NNF09314.1 substrate-binding domain-containing protein [Acidimicrobiia bacterium]NNL69832.1 substrate-binding domain-containing protein [Acidimicrobiia bacterium]
MRWRKVAAVFAALALVAAACGGDDSSDTTAAGGSGDDTFTLGVSNTLVGNAWREQMICAIKAEALARGNVDEVVLQNRNTDVAGQIADIQTLISQGVDAILINPADRSALDDVIEEAASQGIPVIAIDAPVTAPSAYFVSNNQVEYGEVGARWLFEELGGEGKVAYMRGLDGHPADTDRDTGFQAALADYPGIEIVYENWTGWDPSVGAQQALEILTTQEIDGIWTSGIDYTVVEQFDVAGVPYVPVVGADNNEFVNQLISIDGLSGAAVSNPPSVGGVGAAVALDILEGKTVSQETLLTPAVLSDQSELEAVYVPDLTAGWSSYMEIAPYVSYTTDMVVDCKGPGE